MLDLSSSVIKLGAVDMYSNNRLMVIVSVPCAHLVFTWLHICYYRDYYYCSNESSKVCSTYW